MHAEGKKENRGEKGVEREKRMKKLFAGGVSPPPPGLPPACLKLGEYLRFCQREDRGEI